MRMPAEEAPTTPAAQATWTIPAVPHQVAHVRERVTAFAARAGADADTIDAVRLAVSEAVTNAVVHAYPGRPEPGDVHVSATRRDGQVEVRVADTGAGLVPRPDSPGLGLGLPLIATLASSFEVAAPASGGTLVTMTFRL